MKALVKDGTAFAQVLPLKSTYPLFGQRLFPSPAAREGRTVNLDKPFRRCVLAAGLDVKQVVRHTLRHTTITHLVQAGVDLPAVKRISGHKILSMGECYSYQNGGHTQPAMDRLSERYKAKAPRRYL
ncbi:MAG: tyrosine-type recombinase/integrase [Polaromonas sp.]|nr:tyrosine-type recombinase/integrase [Polaromonas sp.]MDP3170475.1 tyrosine-type recombinase/integrase [Polaromonas sp.]